jgi:hypothetical protein
MSDKTKTAEQPTENKMLQRDPSKYSNDNMIPFDIMDPHHIRNNDLVRLRRSDQNS